MMSGIRTSFVAVTGAVIMALSQIPVLANPDAAALRDAIAVSPNDVIAAVVAAEQDHDARDPLCIIRVRVSEVLFQRHTTTSEVAANDVFNLSLGTGPECSSLKIGSRLLVIATPLQMHPETPGYTARALKAAPDQATIELLRAAVEAATR